MNENVKLPNRKLYPKRDISIPKNCYSNLLCYEDFVIRTNLLGYDIYDEVVLRFLTKVNAIDPYRWFVIGEEGNRHICIIDEHGDRVENVVLNGDFGCSCMGLTSLKGDPRVVKGSFSCVGNFFLNPSKALR